MNRTDHTIEDFAYLVAELSSPFALRRAVLARHDLSEEQLRGLNARWGTELTQTGAGGELAARFRSAYAAKAALLRSAELHEASARSGAANAAGARPRFLNEDAQPFRQEAARVELFGAGDVAPAFGGLAVPDTEKLAAAPEMTLELTALPPPMELPFRAPDTAPVTLDELEVESLDDETATLPLGSLAPRAVPRTFVTVDNLPLVRRDALPFAKRDDDKKPKG